MRVAATTLLVSAVCGCSFPSVDYYDDADATTTSTTSTSTSTSTSSSSTGGACTAPKPCNTQASSCGNTAGTKRDSCLKSCKPNDTTCASACTSTYDADVATCISTCEQCSMTHGCADASASCATLSGA